MHQKLGHVQCQKISERPSDGYEWLCHRKSFNLLGVTFDHNLSWLNLPILKTASQKCLPLCCIPNYVYQTRPNLENFSYIWEAALPNRLHLLDSVHKKVIKHLIDPVLLSKFPFLAHHQLIGDMSPFYTSGNFQKSDKRFVTYDKILLIDWQFIIIALLPNWVPFNFERTLNLNFVHSFCDITGNDCPIRNLLRKYEKCKNG